MSYDVSRVVIDTPSDSFLYLSGLLLSSLTQTFLALVFFYLAVAAPELVLGVRMRTF